MPAHKKPQEKKNIIYKTYLCNAELDNRMAAHLEAIGKTHSSFVRELIERELDKAA